MSSKRSITNAPRPFPKRLPRIPTQMQRSAELWLDFFQNAVSCMLADESAKPPDALVNAAHNIADLSLECFEKRWPGVKL